MKTWFTAKADAGVAEISIYDEIGAWGITAKDFQREFRALGPVKDIRVSINSPGGEVFDGLAIHNMLKRAKARVTVTVDGIAASIASVIAMAADELIMPANSMLMIHNPSGVVVGTSKDMRELADALDKIRGSLVSAYADKSGLEPDAIVEMLDAETWLSADEAVALGFADTIEDPVKMAAAFDLSRFRNAPAQAVASLRDPVALNPADQEVELTDENSTDSAETLEPATEIQETVATEPEIEAVQADETSTSADEIVARAITDERTRSADIMAACAIAGRPDRAVEFVASGKSVSDVLAALQSERSNAAPDVSARHVPSQAKAAASLSWDKFTARLNARNG